ncbi:MAG: type I restriction-modification system subunit M [Proteobacteria bacterium]|nr:type I restriction-modification system subunit M [Pseudomonadota bacterium]
MTTAQRLGSLIKSARQIMRKDKGLNGDLDRLPLFTWIMFLKFLDDMEIGAEEEAKLANKKYRPVIEPPYRWRDWAVKADGITGEELLKFISQDETIRPDGTNGAGLFAYLRGLQSESGRNRQDIIANVFKGVTNRMESGYLLRDVINKVSGIHFTASEEMHTLSRLYENMLREMRDAAGDSGEFYTPRPVVKFMVDVTNPQLGETVLDPACGTGGFLVETYDHLAANCRSVEDRRVLQQETLLGQEAKPLPYMLVQMNLLLHGLEYPIIRYGNTLAQKVTEIGDADRVDVILTNPPFGGEEERGILNNFPADKQTAETALLFLQLIMRKLKRPSSGKAGRAAVVVPNGVLFGDGVCARIKEEMLKNYNLHTIIRLPEGTFAPYTDIPANLLFFDRTGPTETIWYYQIQLPEGRKKYSKTMPMQVEDMTECQKWFTAKKRVETDQAWKIDFKKLLDNAVAAATPHWVLAKEAATRAHKLERQAKEVQADLRANSKGTKEKAKLQTHLNEITSTAASERKMQNDEQAAGDAIYWPIFNLDLKNPNSADALVHRQPQELVESILGKELAILRLIEEIQSEVKALL